MSRYVFFLIFSVSIALPATITSGSISTEWGNISPPVSHLVLSGSNFSLSIVTFPLLQTPCICAQNTRVAFDFTQVLSLSSANVYVGGIVGTVTYNGVTYDLGAGNRLNLEVDFAGPIVTAAVNSGPTQGGGTAYGATWAANAFTATGSISLLQGNTVIFSEDLTGAGAASAWFESSSFSGESMASVTYSFSAADYASTPEPSSMGLVAAGLLVAGYWARRKKRLAV